MFQDNNYERGSSQPRYIRQAEHLLRMEDDKTLELTEEHKQHHQPPVGVKETEEPTAAQSRNWATPDVCKSQSPNGEGLTAQQKLASGAEQQSSTPAANSLTGVGLVTNDGGVISPVSKNRQSTAAVIPSAGLKEADRKPSMGRKEEADNSEANKKASTMKK